MKRRLRRLVAGRLLRRLLRERVVEGAGAVGGPGEPPAPARGKRRRRVVAAALLLALGIGGCDDQVKYVPWFSTMTEQPSVETYQSAPVPPPEGTVPVGATIAYDLTAADTALSNPLPAAPENAARGRVQYERFCLPCHGETGAGNGPVMSSAQNPNRMPPLPTANLLSQRARDLSDGYVWGMIENGRGVMPAYARVPPAERWYLIAYVRELQRLAPVP